MNFALPAIPVQWFAGAAPLAALMAATPVRRAHARHTVFQPWGDAGLVALTVVPLDAADHASPS